MSLRRLSSIIRSTFRAYGLRPPIAITIPRSWYAALPRLAALFSSRREHRRFSVLPLYMDHLANPQAFGNEAYLRWLTERGQVLPKADEFLPRVLDYYLHAKKMQ